MKPGERPAFPATYPGGTEGMTIREWYAGMALAGCLAWSPRGTSSQLGAEDAAKEAFLYADAMILESAKPRAAAPLTEGNSG